MNDHFFNKNYIIHELCLNIKVLTNVMIFFVHAVGLFYETINVFSLLLKLNL